MPVQVEAQPLTPPGVAAKDAKNRAFQLLTEAGVERDAAIAAVAAAWDATDHADADHLTTEQAEAFLAGIAAVADEQAGVEDAEVVEDDDEDDPFAIGDTEAVAS